MSHVALGPVSASVYGALSGDATLAGLLVGGVRDDVPQNPTFPFLWYEVRERDVRGFGTGGLPEVDLRLHAFSTYAGAAQAQAIIRQAVEVLRDAALVVSGYRQCGRVVYDDSVLLPNEEINGVKVREVVANFRIYVEEAAA